MTNLRYLTFILFIELIVNPNFIPSPVTVKTVKTDRSLT